MARRDRLGQRDLLEMMERRVKRETLGRVVPQDPPVLLDPRENEETADLRATKAIRVCRVQLDPPDLKVETETWEQRVPPDHKDNLEYRDLLV